MIQVLKHPDSVQLVLTVCVCVCVYVCVCARHQLSDGVLDHFQPISDDALCVVLHQVLAALTSLQLHTNTNTNTLWSRAAHDDIRL